MYIIIIIKYPLVFCCKWTMLYYWIMRTVTKINCSWCYFCSKYIILNLRKYIKSYRKFCVSFWYCHIRFSGTPFDFREHFVQNSLCAGNMCYFHSSLKKRIQTTVHSDEALYPFCYISQMSRVFTRKYSSITSHLDLK